MSHFNHHRTQSKLCKIFTFTLWKVFHHEIFHGLIQLLGIYLFYFFVWNLNLYLVLYIIFLLSSTFISLDKKWNSTLSLHITHIFRLLISLTLILLTKLNRLCAICCLLTREWMKKRVLYEKWAFIVTILHNCDYMYV